MELKIFIECPNFLYKDGLIFKKARIHISTNCLRRDFHVHQ